MWKGGGVGGEEGKRLRGDGGGLRKSGLVKIFLLKRDQDLFL